jgi:hypothetical protein
MGRTRPASPDARLRRGFAVLAVLYAAFAFAFIARTSFVVEGVRHFCLFDDAMISMRYARNLAGGDGLAWNPGGPRVEGFTNPGWVAVMAVVHLLPLPAPLASLPVQGLGAVLLLGSCRPRGA